MVLWVIWIAVLIGVFYVLYRLARASGRRVPHERELRKVLAEPHEAKVHPPPPIDLRARRVEKTVEALERRVIELEARLRKVEGRD